MADEVRQADPIGPVDPKTLDRYEPGSVLLGVILTLVAPFISLIVALVLRGSERNEARRSQLQTWAVASAAYLIVAPLVAIALFSSLADQRPDPKGPCFGGPIMGAQGEPVGGDRYRFPCAGGGSTVVRLQP